MAEYIDKHKAYLLLKDLEAAYIYPPVKEAYGTAARRIDQIKPADVQPVKRGKWLKHGKDDDYLWCCSACKKWIIYAEHDLHKHHFCGNCGADMRQEKSNGKTN